MTTRQTHPVKKEGVASGKWVRKLNIHFFHFAADAIYDLGVTYLDSSND